MLSLVATKPAKFSGTDTKLDVDAWLYTVGK